MFGSQALGVLKLADPQFPAWGAAQRQPDGVTSRSRETKQGYGRVQAHSCRCRSERYCLSVLAVLLICTFLSPNLGCYCFFVCFFQIIAGLCCFFFPFCFWNIFCNAEHFQHISAALVFFQAGTTGVEPVVVFRRFGGVGWVWWGAVC